MPDETDPRVSYTQAFPQHEIDTADDPAFLIGEMVRTLTGQLLAKYPNADLLTLRFDLPEYGLIPGYRTARVRTLLKPEDPAECPSCHAHAGHPHTDYCQSPPQIPEHHTALSAIETGLEQGIDGPDLLAHVAHAIDRERARRRPHLQFLAQPTTDTDRLGLRCGVHGVPLNACHCPTSAADRTPPPIPVHRCTDPTCPIHGAHAHAGNDVLTRHPWCTCEWLEQWRTWPGQPHRPGCPVLTHPTPPPTPPTT